MFVICFNSQWMKRSKHGLFVFPPKKTLMWRRHCSIGQSCRSMTSKRSIGWQVLGHEGFPPERSLNQPKGTRVCIRSINQSNRSISVRFLFLFCLRVFISRSYENRSIQNREVSCENNFRGMWVLFLILFKIMLEGNRSKVGKIEFNGNEDNVPNQPSFNVFN